MTFDGMSLVQSTAGWIQLISLAGDGMGVEYQLVDTFSLHSEPLAPPASHQQNKGLGAFTLMLSLSSTSSTRMSPSLSPFRRL